MDTLHKLRNVKFDFVCVPHSVSIEDSGTHEEVCAQFMMEGPSKLQAYIKYREDRIEQLK